MPQFLRQHMGCPPAKCHQDSCPVAFKATHSESPVIDVGQRWLFSFVLSLQKVIDICNLRTVCEQKGTGRHLCVQHAQFNSRAFCSLPLQCGPHWLLHSLDCSTKENFLLTERYLVLILLGLQTSIWKEYKMSWIILPLRKCVSHIRLTARANPGASTDLPQAAQESAITKVPQDTSQWTEGGRWRHRGQHKWMLGLHGEA